MKTSFNSKVAYWFGRNEFLMPGLDITKAHIPGDFEPMLVNEPEKRHTKFITHFVDTTAPYCLGWKPNLKFYEGSVGRARLEAVCRHITEKFPQHILLGDNKDGDIGNTNKQVLDYYVDTLKLDAFTLNPLMGYEDSMEIFLSNPNVAGFLLCLTSNKGSKDLLQKTVHESDVDYHTAPNFEMIAVYAKSQRWNINNNVHLVVGATNSVENVRKIRKVAGENAIFLLPGFGAQKGDPKILEAARNSAGKGIFGVVARELIEPKRNDGESYDDAVIRTAKIYQKLFAGEAVAA